MNINWFVMRLLSVSGLNTFPWLRLVMVWVQFLWLSFAINFRFFGTLDMLAIALACLWAFDIRSFMDGYTARRHFLLIVLWNTCLGFTMVNFGQLTLYWGLQLGYLSLDANLKIQETLKHKNINAHWLDIRQNQNHDYWPVWKGDVNIILSIKFK